MTAQAQSMEVVVSPCGILRCVYDECLDLSRIGQVSIRRGSHVEPDENGSWQADMSPVGGPMLGPFPTRSMALLAERQWLSANWLVSPDR